MVLMVLPIIQYPTFVMVLSVTTISINVGMVRMAEKLFVVAMVSSLSICVWLRKKRIVVLIILEPFVGVSVELRVVMVGSMFSICVV